MWGNVGTDGTYPGFLTRLRRGLAHFLLLIAGIITTEAAPPSAVFGRWAPRTSASCFVGGWPHACTYHDSGCLTLRGFRRVSTTSPGAVHSSHTKNPIL